MRKSHSKTGSTLIFDLFLTGHDESALWINLFMFIRYDGGSVDRGSKLEARAVFFIR